jgi:hypothetical protein
MSSPGSGSNWPSWGGDAEAYRQFLGVPAFQHPAGLHAVRRARAVFCSTLEFNGIGSGYQGEGTKTVIPEARRW